jgi:hypothetical protein
MRSRDLLSVIATVVALSGTTGCSSKSDSSQSMAPQGNDSFSAGQAESPSAPVNPATAHLTSGAAAAPVTTIPTRAQTTSTTRTDLSQQGATYDQSRAVGQSSNQSSNSNQLGYQSADGSANQSAVPYNDARANGAMAGGNAQYGSGAYSNAGSPDDYRNQGDRHVRVNMPLVHVNVDRDNGGVHIDVPFVHINKPGRFEPAQVSVPDRIDQSSAVSQDRY